MFNLEKEKINSTSEIKNAFNPIVYEKDTPPWGKVFNPTDKIGKNEDTKDWFEDSIKIGSLTVEERQDKLYSLRESFMEKKEEKLKLEKEVSEDYVKYLSGEILLEKYNEISSNKFERVQTLSQEMKDIRQEFKSIKEYTQMENVINEKEKRIDLLKSELDSKYSELKSIKNENAALMQKAFTGEIIPENINKNREKFENIVSDIK
ncbi:hypothetical protein ACFFHT_10325 [Gallibacterium melopsittaci]|uniref:Uncharacterized protein n=1 Tax=Gallibacterium melopsittaci TaxID=516063 RepID=A0ABV6HYI1_9PAST